MVLGRDRREWKRDYFVKVHRLLREYNRIFVCNADNVSSKQFQNIRQGMRGHGDVLMGKNTLIKRAIKDLITDLPELEKLTPLITGNVGFVLTNGDLKEVRDLIETFTVPASAKAGTKAPVPVVVPPQQTILGPEKTSFFQALAIPTKINRGSIEITSPVNLLKVNEKVSESAAMLLNMLKISPFSYGFDIIGVYDCGTVFDPAVLDITDDDIRAHFLSGVQNVASVSLAIGYPTVASVPHSIANAFKTLMAVAAATDIEFPQVAQMKAFLADPSAFIVEAPAEAVEEAKPDDGGAESDASDGSSMSGGFDMFGGDDSDF